MRLIDERQQLRQGSESENRMTEKSTTKKTKQRRNKSNLGPNFIAPDGGWGWLVAIAAGCSNVMLIYSNFNYVTTLHY